MNENENTRRAQVCGLRFVGNGRRAYGRTPSGRGARLFCTRCLQSQRPKRQRRNRPEWDRVPAGVRCRRNDGALCERPHVACQSAFRRRTHFNTGKGFLRPSPSLSSRVLPSISLGTMLDHRSMKEPFDSSLRAPENRSTLRAPDTGEGRLWWVVSTAL